VKALAAGPFVDGSFFVAVSLILSIRIATYVETVLAIRLYGAVELNPFAPFGMVPFLLSFAFFVGMTAIAAVALRDHPAVRSVFYSFAVSLVLADLVYDLVQFMPLPASATFFVPTTLSALIPMVIGVRELLKMEKRP
jgi:hypothetical protein